MRSIYLTRRLAERALASLFRQSVRRRGTQPGGSHLPFTKPKIAGMKTGVRQAHDLEHKSVSQRTRMRGHLSIEPGEHDRYRSHNGDACDANQALRRDVIPAGA